MSVDGVQNLSRYGQDPFKVALIAMLTPHLDFKNVPDVVVMMESIIIIFHADAYIYLADSE